MLTVLSPARNVKPFTPEGIRVERPLFLGESEEILAVLREKSPWELENLLDLDGEKAFAMFEYYRALNLREPGEAMLSSFYGAAFRAMGTEDFAPEDWAFAQAHLRVFSAFYGLLRPFDGMQNHRLGLGGLKPRGGDLYAFWGAKIHAELFREGEELLNIASQDYFRLVKPFLRPEDRVTHCRFLVRKQGRLSATVAGVRLARGLMARYLVKERIDSLEDVKGFNEGGYRFHWGLSDAKTLVFVQD
ncbi:MAG: YaaA family protein [Christensenellaceae bacterium]|nr:YaaA family protein [Christensenellaceae bacterium]